MLVLLTCHRFHKHRNDESFSIMFKNGIKLVYAKVNILVFSMISDANIFVFNFDLMFDLFVYCRYYLMSIFYIKKKVN